MATPDINSTLLLHHNSTISILTKPTASNLSKCNPQSTSPLFSMLPAELRNNIFELVIQTFEDQENKYHETDYFYRPNHHAKHKTHTALLETCRLAWLETNHLPLRNFEPCFWFKDNDRRPEWTKRNAEFEALCRRNPHVSYCGDFTVLEGTRFKIFMSTMTPAQAKNLKVLHFFTQIFWLESHCLGVLLGETADVQTLLPERIVITVRYTDWWDWEDGEELRMDMEWIKYFFLAIKHVRRTVRVELELETIEGKEGQVRGIVEKITREYRKPREQWKLEIGSGREVVGEWKGPANIGGMEWAVHEDQGLKELKYKIFRMVWKR